MSLSIDIYEYLPHEHQVPFLNVPVPKVVNLVTQRCAQCRNIMGARLDR